MEKCKKISLISFENRILFIIFCYQFYFCKIIYYITTYFLIKLKMKSINGDGGLGIGDWGLGPIPNPQSPIPNPQSPDKKYIFKYKLQ